MSAALRAGFVYATGVFGAGYVLGAIRLRLLVPHLGTTYAVLLEAPLMLGVSWWVSRWCVGQWAVSARPGPRILMGVVALVVLLSEELALAVLAFAQSPGAYARGLFSVAGGIGFGAQLLFACFPLIQAERGEGTLAATLGDRRPRP